MILHMCMFENPPFLSMTEADFSSCYLEDALVALSHCQMGFNGFSGDTGKRKKKMVVGGGGTRRVVYPFAIVKPGGVEGEVTLKETNQRILMPPTRPVRHLVGDLVYRQWVSSGGVGLSGKAVVALTKIKTHGRGTITIIRTKG